MLLAPVNTVTVPVESPVTISSLLGKYNGKPHNLDNYTGNKTLQKVKSRLNARLLQHMRLPNDCINFCLRVQAYLTHNRFYKRKSKQQQRYG